MEEKKQQRTPMLQETAPAFRASTTQGEVNFPEDYKGKWVVFFSHPADFTPVCSTEFLMFGKMTQNFKDINTELIGLSIDSTPSHIAWLRSLENIVWAGIQEMHISFPIISDITMDIAKQYGMLHENASSTDTVRTVFIIDPDSKVRAILHYPLTTGRNINEILRLVIALQVSDKEHVSTPANWLPGDDVILPTPRTLEHVNQRYEQPSNGYYCLDWYLCFRELKTVVFDKELTLPVPRRLDRKVQIFDIPLDTPVAPQPANMVAPVQANITSISDQPLINPHENIYDMVSNPPPVTPTPTTSQPMMPQPNNTRSNIIQASKPQPTNFIQPPRIHQPTHHADLRTNSGRIIPSCPTNAQPVFYPEPKKSQLLTGDIDTSHKIGIRL